MKPNAWKYLGHGAPSSYQQNAHSSNKGATCFRALVLRKRTEVAHDLAMLGMPILLPSPGTHMQPPNPLEKQYRKCTVRPRYRQG